MASIAHPDEATKAHRELPAPPMNRVECKPDAGVQGLDEWLTPGRFAVVLALLICATFPDVLILGRTFIARDFGMFGYPMAYFHRESFWHGQLPLWNPYSHCGIPFLAQWNTLTLYPPSLIYLLLPLNWSLSFFCLVHLFWGGLGMYFLAWRWTDHRLAAGLAGIAFSFNGLFLNAMMWPNNAATFGWLPWVIWLVPASWHNGGKSLIWGTLAASMQMLTGGPEVILLTWIVVSLLAAGDWIHCPELRARIAVRFFGSVALVVLVCAAQLLPFLDLLFRSQRDSGFGSASDDWSMPASGLANLLVPLFGSGRTPSGSYLQNGQYWTSSYYAGIGTVLLVAVAIWHVRRWQVRWLTGLLVLGLVLALGKHGLLYPFLRSCVPALGFIRFPVKFVILVLAIAPLLAACGLAKLAAEPKTFGRFEWACAIVMFTLIGVIMVSGWKNPTAHETTPAILENALVRGGFLILIVLLLALLSSSNQRRLLPGSLLLAVSWLDLATHMPNQNPTVRPHVYLPGFTQAHANWTPEPKLGQSRAMISPTALSDLKYHSLSSLEETYLLQRLSLLANCNLLDGVPQVHGFFSLTPAEVNNVTAIPYLYPETNFAPLLDFMGVAQITAPGRSFDWAPRTTAMPLITGGQQPVFADDRAVFSAFFQTNLDLNQVVYLPGDAAQSLAGIQPASVRVWDVDCGNHRLSARIAASNPALVVIAQTYYPSWKAYIDGKPARLWRGNYAFQAVQTPAGDHEILLKYQDKPFKAGTMLSGVGLGACICLWLLDRGRFRPSPIRSDTAPQTTAASETV
jgi:hypothetical protein